MRSAGEQANHMGWVIYNLLLMLAFPAIVLVLLTKSRCRPGFRQRLGCIPHHLLAFRQRPIWIHAVSLGEVQTVVPLVKALRASYPHIPLVVSTITETGREAVERRLAGIADHCYLPLDVPWAVRAYLQALRPLAFICVETELWPNLFRGLAREGVPIVLVNGRISSRSFRRYLWVRPFMRNVLNLASLCLMQSDRDVQRMCRLGAEADRVFRIGNMKFDQSSSDEMGEPPLTREALGLRHDDVLLVAGSTHPGEEDVLLRSYGVIVKEFPRTVLLLAPRHIERADEVEDRVMHHGFAAIRRSRVERESGQASTNFVGRVIVLDTRGELSRAYAFGVVAFVGGTLVPVGGHNVLEPARWGKPVLFGPHVDHCLETAEMLLRAGGGLHVQDEGELIARWRAALSDPEWVERVGRAARSVVESNQGVVARASKHIARILADAHGLVPMTEREAIRPWASLGCQASASAKQASVGSTSTGHGRA